MKPSAVAGKAEAAAATAERKAKKKAALKRAAEEAAVEEMWPAEVARKRKRSGNDEIEVPEAQALPLAHAEDTSLAN